MNVSIEYCMDLPDMVLHDAAIAQAARENVLKEVYDHFVGMYLAMYRGEPWTGPIILLITFIRAVPKRCSKANRRQHLSGVAPPVTKPDSSNYLKFYEDCGTGILWVDDAQIVDHTVRKRYGEEEGVHIQVIRYGT